jgi:hypothetical protein
MEVLRGAPGGAPGGNNQLLAGSDGGADCSVIVCSLSTTAKLTHREPYAYLKGNLERLTNGHPASCLDAFSPGTGRLRPDACEEWTLTPKGPIANLCCVGGRQLDGDRKPGLEDLAGAQGLSSEGPNCRVSSKRPRRRRLGINLIGFTEKTYTKVSAERLRDCLVERLGGGPDRRGRIKKPA